MLMAMTKGPDYALYVAVLYLGVQFVESYLLGPVIQQYAVSLPAALILFNQIMLGILLGGMGVVLATPIAATLLVAVKMLWIFLGTRVQKEWKAAVGLSEPHREWRPAKSCGIALHGDRTYPSACRGDDL